MFDRLLDLNWKHDHLLKYLASQGEHIIPAELARLKMTAFFPKEEAGGPSSKLYMAKELFAPTDANKDLDLPVMSWPKKWRSHDDECRRRLLLDVP